MRKTSHDRTGVEMSARRRRIPLICSVLFGALIISCQASPTVGPAPPPVAEPAVEAEPGGGLQSSEPEPAAAPTLPRVASPPAPRTLPAPAPQAPAPPWRPGGAPPRAELVVLPGGGDLDQWLKDMNKACRKAHYGSNCLNLDINYDPPGKPHNNCSIDNQEPDIGERVTTSRPIKLEVTCDPLPTPTPKPTRTPKPTPTPTPTPEATPN